MGLLTALTIAITFVLPPVADSELAGGAAIAIFVLGLSWLIGWSGQISLGNSGFMAVGAYAVGIWARHHTTTPLIFTFVLATVAGAISGLVIAIPSTSLRGPYLAGMTLAFSAAVTPTRPKLHLDHRRRRWHLLELARDAALVRALLSAASNASLNANAQWTADLAVIVAGVTFFFMANLFHSRTGSRHAPGAR